MEKESLDEKVTLSWADRTESDALARANAIREVMQSATLESTQHWVDAAAMILVDSVTSAQLLPLEAFLDAAARASGSAGADENSLNALAAVAHWGVARTVPQAIGRTIDLGSHLGRTLSYVANNPGCSSTEIGISLGLNETVVSKIGTRLQVDGFVMRIQAGKWRHWRITRAGETALEAALMVHGDEADLVNKDALPDHLEAALSAHRRITERRNSPGVPHGFSVESKSLEPSEEFLNRVRNRERRRDKGD